MTGAHAKRIRGISEGDLKRLLCAKLYNVSFTEMSSPSRLYGAMALRSTVTYIICSLGKQCTFVAVSSSFSAARRPGSCSENISLSFLSSLRRIFTPRTDLFLQREFSFASEILSTTFNNAVASKTACFDERVFAGQMTCGNHARLFPSLSRHFLFTVKSHSLFSCRFLRYLICISAPLHNSPGAASASSAC